MKIGVDSTALTSNPTGVGNYISRLLVPLVMKHTDIEFVLFSNNEVLFPNFPNVRIRVSFPKRRGPYWQNTQLRKMLIEEKPDVFWATNGLMPFGMPKHITTILTVHDLVYRFAPETLPLFSLWGRRIGQAAAVKSANFLVAVSHATSKDVCNIYRRIPDSVIAPLADRIFQRPTSSVVSDMRKKLNLMEPYLFTLGTLEPRKNIVRLVQAYLSLRAQNISLPLLVIAGGKGWLDSDIAEELSLGESLGHVRRLGYVANEDLPALYAACEVFLMPSIYEGFGMPLLEAQLCGAPVIHGSHASMCEAAGGLGVETDVSVNEIKKTLLSYSMGNLPLTCRCSADISNDQNTSSNQLWELMVGAKKHSI